MSIRLSFGTSLELGEGNTWLIWQSRPPMHHWSVHHLHPLKYTFSLHVFDTSLILGFKRGCWKLLLSINNLPTNSPQLLSFQFLSYSFTTPGPRWDRRQAWKCHLNLIEPISLLIMSQTWTTHLHLPSVRWNQTEKWLSLIHTIFTFVSKASDELNPML